MLARVSAALPKARRLRKRSEFLALQQGGIVVHTRHFLVVIAAGAGRVGITVSKKVGNAVTRNRIRRLVREFYRTSDWPLRPFDVVVIAKRAAGTADLRAGDVARELSQLSGRLC